MSGGHFDYAQFQLFNYADDIREEAAEESPEVAAAYREGARLLTLAATYMHRIDWHISGDTGDETFLRRLAEDLAELEGKAKP